MRHRFGDMNCSVAQSLEALGDWWTLLIVRECFLGTRRFADFESVLGISKNVLTQRLQHLTEHGILEKVDAGRHGPRFEYQLTDKGKDLATLMAALRQWGDRWVFGEGKEPLLVVDRRTGQPVERIRMLDAEGKPLAGRHVGIAPGPGASEETRARCRELTERS